MKRFLIILKGRVQGVGCRYFVCNIAAKYKLTGYVRNLENGDVEIKVQGESEQLDKFLAEVIKGDRFIRINDYAIKGIPLVEGETKFSYKY